MRILAVLLVGLAVLRPALASAEVTWTLLKKEGRAYLQGLSGVEEGDEEFWLQCRADKAVDLGAGGETGVGTGKGEAVTLTLSSDGKTAKLSGTSRNTRNFQMTAGVELRTKVSRDDPVFAVLATGKAIKVTGSIKPVTWPVKGLKAKVAAFLQACR